MANSENLKKIKNKIVVLSGKGGVGKSTIATNLALSLSLKGYKTGLLDIDIHGPSIPTLLNLSGIGLCANEKDEIIPYQYNDTLKVVSIGLLIEDQDAPIIWKGPMKAGYIRDMIDKVEWNELDYLIVDCPPGTGDEPLSIIQELGDDTKTVIVTTPQKLSIADVRKSINFCKKLNTKIIGLIENMSGFVCPNCNEITEIFQSGNGQKMAKEMDVSFLGKIPLDPKISQAADDEKPYIQYYQDSSTAKIIDNIIDNNIK